ncbi:MAG TPA: CPBP family intramembrane glutamic endopeptidase [Gemmataceae bacterium]|nr:CPBP family intramembrane glutamic endopeptidase [Gemmataceae bacterium]
MKWWDENARATLIAYAAIAVPALVLLVALRPRKLLPMQRLRFGSWNGSAVLAHSILWMAMMIIAYQVFDRLGLQERLLPAIELPKVAAGAAADAEADPPKKGDPLMADPLKAAERLKAIRLSNLSQPLGALAFLALSFTLLRFVQRSPISSAGMTRARWRPNVLLGLAAFVIVTPPIFAIEMVCVGVFGAEQHPIEVLGRLNGLEMVEWASILVSVVFLGPISEEWIFRGLMQGWLRRASYLEHAVFVCLAAALVGYFVVARKGANIEVPIALVAWTAALAAVDLAGIYMLYRPLHEHGLGYFRRPDLPPLAKEEQTVDAWTVNLFEAEGREHLLRPWREFGSRWFSWKVLCARWSIVGTAMFFALVHNAWPTPIPLFFLGLVLGWLAFRTQSLVPSIVVHGLFNLVSYLALVFLSQ